MEDCRDRLGKAYAHLSHCSDIHLATTHPRLAKKARDLRKTFEPAIFGRVNGCPPKEACERIEEFKQEVLHELEKFEGHHQKQEVVAAQSVSVLDVQEDNSIALLFGVLLVGAIASSFLRPQ